MSAWPQGKGRRIAIGSSGFQTQRNSQWQVPTSAGNRASLSLETIGPQNAPRNPLKRAVENGKLPFVRRIFILRQPEQNPRCLVRVYRFVAALVWVRRPRVPTHQLIDLLRQYHDPALPCTCLEGIITLIFLFNYFFCFSPREFFCSWSSCRSGRWPAGRGSAHEV